MLMSVDVRELDNMIGYQHLGAGYQVDVHLVGHWYARYVHVTWMKHTDWLSKIACKVAAS